MAEKGVVIGRIEPRREEIDEELKGYLINCIDSFDDVSKKHKDRKEAVKIAYKLLKEDKKIPLFVGYSLNLIKLYRQNQSNIEVIKKTHDCIKYIKNTVERIKDDYENDSIEKRCLDYLENKIEKIYDETTSLLENKIEEIIPLESPDEYEKATHYVLESYPVDKLNEIVSNAFSNPFSYIITGNGKKTEIKALDFIIGYGRYLTEEPLKNGDEAIKQYEIIKDYIGKIPFLKERISNIEEKKLLDVIYEKLTYKRDELLKKEEVWNSVMLPFLNHEEGGD